MRNPSYTLRSTAKRAPVAKPRGVMFIEASATSKLSPIEHAVSVTYAPIAVTCPDTCEMKGAGCYAQSGNVALHNRRVETEAAELGLTALETAQAEASAIDGAFRAGVPQDGARGGRDLRLHVSGDCALPEGARALGKAARRWRARGGGAVWTYTHAWRTVPRAAWGRSVSVLASCDKPSEVAAARKRGYAVAIVVPEHAPDGKAWKDSAGNTWIPCPQQTREIPCTVCRLCLNADGLAARDAGIAFAAHGTSKNAIKRRLPLIA